MRVISPITITDAKLSSSSVAETTPAAWSAATDYAVGAQVNVAHVIYESVQTPNINHAPATTPLYWAAVGPSNRWAMFDSEISTATTATSAITVVLLPGNCNALALIGLIGAQLVVTVRDTAGGAIVWQQTVSLDGTIIIDWYQYFFEEFVLRGEVAFINLPPMGAATEVTVALTGGGTVAIAHLAIGTAYDLGKSLMGVAVGIIDYSRKDVSATGVISLAPRKFSHRMSLQTLLPATSVNKIKTVLAGLRARPCVWLGDETLLREELVVFGFYRDFSIDIAYPTAALCNIEIEGMT